jgi:transposase
MMGKQPASEGKLFYYDISLERRIPAKHRLRQIKETVDFAFVYEQVKDCYGVKGNVSVPPPIILKLMLLLFLYDVRSERELIETLPYRLDWLWFCDYDIDSEVPNHSVLSKARARWGVAVFETLFARVVAQCAAAGLVDGRKIHLDGSLVEANASISSIVKGPAELIAQLRASLRSETAKLDEPIERSESSRSNEDPSPRDGAGASGPRKNQAMTSTTDPEAAIVGRGRQTTRARYKNHRVVDDRCGVITATETTPGDVEENARLVALVQQHEQNTHCCVETAVADAQYGTAENFLACYERGIAGHMGDLRASQSNKGRREGIFGHEDFTYHRDRDIYTCPAGQTLTRRSHKRRRQAYEYACSKTVCRVCRLRLQCTKARDGAARTLQRHDHQEVLDAARRQSHRPAAKRDRRRRLWRMEGSFGDAASRHGFKRSRWRGLWRQRIQDLLIATVQNLRLFMGHACKRAASGQAWASVLAWNGPLAVPVVLFDVAATSARHKPSAQ